MRTRAVLFDLDNTLVHRSRSIASYAATFCRDFAAGLETVPVAEVAALIDHRDNGGYLQPDSPFATVRDDVAHALANRLRWASPAFEDEIRAHWTTQFPRHAIEMPGAIELISRLVDAGLRIGIVSNGAESSRRVVAGSAGVDRQARTLVSSERAGVRKPDPWIFELAATELGVPMQACWFVGDHPANDIQGARQAGMRAVWLEGFHDWTATTPAMHRIRSLAEVDALVLADLRA